LAHVKELSSVMAIVESFRALFVAPACEADARAHGNNDTSETFAARMANRWLPSRCLLCSDACAHAVCAPCDASLARTSDASCPRCRLPASNGEVCGRCLRFPPKWHRLDARFMYEFPLDRLIVGAKHARFWGVFDWATTIENWPFAPNAMLVPVPLAAERIEARGYNQASLLAHSIAKRFGLRVDEEALIRVRAAGTQANRNWVERRRNVKDAFAATRSLAGEAVVLIDDVLTTGATLNECARTALEAGAASVDAFVIARVNPPRARDRVQKFNRVVA
jgi:ComF family protein